jgi:tetratricopeptide (TPR) repeat protein
MSPNRISFKNKLTAFSALALMHGSVCSANSSSIYLQQGIAAYNSGNYAVAEADLKIEVSTSPNNALAHYYLGNTYLQLKQTVAAYAEFKKGLELSPVGQLHNYCLVALERMEATWPEFTRPTEVAIPFLSTMEHIEKQTGDTSDNPLAAQAHAYFEAKRNRDMQRASAANPALLDTFKRIKTQSDIVEQNIGAVGRAVANDSTTNGLLEIDALKRQRDQKIAAMKASGTPCTQSEIDKACAFYNSKIAEIQARLEDSYKMHQTDAAIETRHFQNDVHDLTDQLTSTKSLPGTPVLQAAGTSLYTRQYGDPSGTPKKEKPPEELVATPETLTLDAHTAPGKFIYRTTKQPGTAPSRFGADLDVRGTFLKK